MNMQVCANCKKWFVPFSDAIFSILLEGLEGQDSEKIVLDFVIPKKYKWLCGDLEESQNSCKDCFEQEIKNQINNYLNKDFLLAILRIDEEGKLQVDWDMYMRFLRVLYHSADYGHKSRVESEINEILFWLGIFSMKAKNNFSFGSIEENPRAFRIGEPLFFVNKGDILEYWRCRGSHREAKRVFQILNEIK